VKIKGNAWSYNLPKAEDPLKEEVTVEVLYSPQEARTFISYDKAFKKFRILDKALTELIGTV
jgi:hypothetical protein